NMKNIASVLGLALLFSACGNNEEQRNEEETTISAPAVSLSEVDNSPEFNDAAIALGKVTAEAAGDSAKVTFNFEVKNYELKSQTSDADSKMCNNSEKGQHIHFIMDNQPYAALYEPNHTVSLAKNSEHYLMAFLSRSYHESVKSKGAALVYHFK